MAPLDSSGRWLLGNRPSSVRYGTALTVMAAALAVGAPQTALAQAQADPTSPDQTAADPEGGTQVQSSDEQAVARSAADQSIDPTQIVVTGTILRGAPPVGSNLISVGEERLQSQGATTSNELLATVPQVSNLFNNVPAARLSTTPNVIQVVRPNLRNLSPETSSSASTLVLIDGHRIAAVGITQQAVDPDVIPPGAIERVEVVTDGGSATYGSDAVGGVINFITRKRFDGLKIDARYGFADDYYTVDGNITAGRDWGSGSLFGSASYQRNDALFGRDRDYIRTVDWSTPALTPLGRSCSPGNVQIASGAGAGFYPLPSLGTVNSPNVCDQSDDQSYIPRGERYAAIAGLHQDLADWLTVDLRAFYAKRKSRSFGPLRGTATVTGGATPQAFYRPIAANPTSNQAVFYTFAPVLGNESGPLGADFEEWGANAEFKVDLNDNWQLRTLFNYSRSYSQYFIVGPNAALLNTARTATNPANAVNFYDPAATPNLDLIRAIANNYATAGQARDDLTDLRAIVDGRLFELPGGDVRIAAGFEYLHDSYQQRLGSDIVPGALSSIRYDPYSRSVNSFFGELLVPIFGENNRTTAFYSLVVNASVRHDRFSDVGNTTNPKFGATWKPIEWLSLRGNYSTSFNAPAPVDLLGVANNQVNTFAFAPFIRPADVGSVSLFSHGAVALQGSVPGISPQTASTYSVGIDIDPPFLEGLRASVNYYHVKFENLIDTPTGGTGIFANFPGNIMTSVAGFSRAEVEAFAAGGPNGVARVQGLLASGQPVYSLIDFRRGNYGTLKVNGIDFAVSYRRSTGFGGIDASVSGNYQLDRETQVAPGAPVIDRLRAYVVTGFANGSTTPSDAQSRLNLQALLGADIGNFRAQATLNHTAGFDLVPRALLFQDEVDDFNTVNLFFKYDVAGDGFLLRDLSFTLNINNVFDENPPILRSNEVANNPGYTNGFTIGRLVQVGVSKKF